MILFLGNGFIANAFSATLNNEKIGHRIVSKDIEDVPPARIQADICLLIENESLLDGIDTVVYFAHSSVPYSSMQNIMQDAEQNILTAIPLFEIFAAKKIRVIYISSGGSVYGNQTDLTSEESLPSPVSAYGLSKYTIENYLRLFHHNYHLPYDILRLSNVYGIGQKNNRPQGIICALASAFIEKKKFEIWGDGTAKKDYLYIDDVVDALAKVAASPASNDTFNISFGRSTSILEIISLFEKILGYTIEIATGPQFDFDVQNVFLDNRKFAAAYGWSPKTDIKQGIRKTIEWRTDHK